MLIKRLRTWLFIASVLVAVFGPIVVSYCNRTLDTEFQANGMIQIQPTLEMGAQNASSKVECIPVVEQAVYTVIDKMVVDESVDTVSLRIAELFAADQSVRQLPVDASPQELDEGDINRRTEVLGYIANGQVHAARDLVYAAYIFQHGDCSEHYRLGNRLAQLAMDAGYLDARWIYAATLDRYLMSLGELQKYGTQYTWREGKYELYPVDPTTTDTERAKYNVPPLNSRGVVEDGGGTVQRRWLETWWLTLIGAGFAGLSAIVGIVDREKNALYGRMVLTIAIGLYVVSVVGHYTQINAMVQGTAELQGNIWRIVNVLMIVFWLLFALVEIVRVVKAKSAQQPAEG